MHNTKVKCFLLNIFIETTQLLDEILMQEIKPILVEILG